MCIRNHTKTEELGGDDNPWTPDSRATAKKKKGQRRTAQLELMSSGLNMKKEKITYNDSNKLVIGSNAQDKNWLIHRYTTYNTLKKLSRFSNGPTGPGDFQVSYQIRIRIIKMGFAPIVKICWPC